MWLQPVFALLLATWHLVIGHRSTGDSASSQALQRAIKAARDNRVADGKLIKGIDQTWAHPAAWALFSLVGDGAR